MENNIDTLKKLEVIYKSKFELEERRKSIPKYLEMKKFRLKNYLKFLLICNKSLRNIKKKTLL